MIWVIGITSAIYWYLRGGYLAADNTLDNRRGDRL